jgi:uncharacterized membrane protein YeaQ/YmgE (transglycosylase-associated protein family)
MSTFADITLEPSTIALWMAAGLLAGWLAGQLISIGNYGFVAELLVGLAGAVIGGVLFGALTTGPAAVLGSLGAAFLGACILIVVARLVASRLSEA